MQRFSPKASTVLEKAKKVFTMYGHGGYLGEGTATIFSSLSLPRSKEAPYEIGAKLALRLQRRSSFESVNGQTDGHSNEWILMWLSSVILILM